MTDLNVKQTSVMMHETLNPGFSWTLALGDWLAIVLFVAVGQTDHGTLGGAAIPSLLITALSFAVPFTIASVLLGGYRPDNAAGLGSWLGRVLVVWLVAAPLGLALRALIRGQASVILVFMIVALGIGGLFVLGWRAFYWWWRARKVAPVTA